MYRAPIKDQFLRECFTTEVSKNTARAVLERIAPYEERLELDISAIRGDALQDVIAHIVGIRGGSFVTDLRVLRSYVRWCIINRIPGACDDILSIQFSGVEKYRRRAVASPAHLQIYLDQVFNPESDETIDVIYRSYFWLAFAGIKEEDSVKIHVNQLDFEHMQIKFVNGEVYPIYSEALPALRKAASLNDFAYRNPNYKNGKVARKDRIGGDLLLRGIKKGSGDDPAVLSYRTAASKKARLAEETGKTTQRLSYSSVYPCGIFFRAYHDEQAGLEVKFYHQASIDCKSTNHESIQKLARYYEEDYQLWKLAFQV